MSTVYIEVKGEPVQSTEVDWLMVAPCGCPSGVLVADLGDRMPGSNRERFLDEDAAALAINWNKAATKRAAEQGFTYRPIRHADFTAEVGDLKCPHDPRWGVPPVPKPDGYVWATTDGDWGSRATYLTHLVRDEDADNYQAISEPLCGRKRPRAGGVYRTDRHYTSDCVECLKCIAKATALQVQR